MTALRELAPRREAQLRPLSAEPPRQRTDWGRVAGTVVVIGLFAFSIYSLFQLEFSWDNIVSSLGTALTVFEKMDPISLPAPGDLAYLIGQTVGIVVLGTLLAALLSVPVAIIAAENTSPAGWLRWVGRSIGVVARAIPDVVIALALALMFVLGSPLPGIIALGLHSIGMISKLFADAIEQIDNGPRLAIRTAGAGPWQEFWAGVFPQVLPAWIAVALHRFDINLRGSVILGYAGVGGLGYAMKLAFEDFPEGYGRGLGIAAVIFVLCIIGEIVSSALRRSLLGAAPTGRGIGDRVVRAASSGRPPRRRSRGSARPLTVDAMMRQPWTGARVRNKLWLFTAVLVVVGSVLVSRLSLDDVDWNYVWPTLASFWPPSLGDRSFWEYFQAMLTTVQVACAAAVLAFVFSLLLGSFAARNVAPNGLVRNVFRVILVIIRGVPELVLAIFLIMVTGLGNQAGVIALAFGGIGLLGKLIADSFEEVPSGPERALTAVGARRSQRFLAATLPQGVPSLVSNSLYLVDTNIRAATLLGIVGGTGIGFYLTIAAPLVSLHGQVTFLVILIVVTVLLVEGIAAFLRRVFR